MILVLGSNKMLKYSENFNCKTENDTKRLAQLFASSVQKGDVIALYGTLGVGKSTFSRFFIQHLTNATEVPSPTFTLVQSYDTSDFTIFHYDMYRLEHPEDAYELGVEESFFMGVNLIEWPEKIENLLPRNIWKVCISSNLDSRIFSVSVSDDEKKKRLEKIAHAF